MTILRFLSLLADITLIAFSGRCNAVTLILLFAYNIFHPCFLCFIKLGWLKEI